MATAYLGQILRAFVGLAPGKEKGEQGKAVTEGSSGPTSRDMVDRQVLESSGSPLLQLGLGAA